MASLFDIAAGLSQFDSNSDDDPYTKDNAEIAPEEQERGSGRDHNVSESRCNPRVSATPLSRRQPALCILDETLQTIYDTRRASVTPSLSASTSSEQLGNRLQQLNTTAKQHASSSQSSSSSELRKVFTHSISYQQLQQMQTTTSSYSNDAPPPSKPRSSQSTERHSLGSGGDPDMIAKTVLREISDEIDQLGMVAGSASAQRSPDDQDSMVRFLTEKYIDARLNKLPGTPFVQLARRKVLQKINQLQHQQRQSLSNDKDTRAQSVNRIAAADVPSHRLELQQHPPLGAGAGEQLLWQKLDALTPQQHEMLRKLARVPEAHVASLSAAQRELLQFAKRLELLKSIPGSKIGNFNLGINHNFYVLRK